MSPICPKCAALRFAQDRPSEGTRALEDGEVCVDCGDVVHQRQAEETDHAFRARLMAQLSKEIPQ